MDNFTYKDYVEKINDAYVPSIPTLYSLFMNGNAINESSADDLEQQRVVFKTVTTLGEIEAAPISEQSTEINRFKSGQKTKDYFKFLEGVAWKRKGLTPSYENFQTISNQALNKLLSQEDEEFCTGKDANGVQRNNGLFISSDPDYVAETDTNAVPTTLSALQIELSDKIDQINQFAPGEKWIITWGDFKNSIKKFPTEQSEKLIRDILETSLDGALFPRIITDFTKNLSAAEKGKGGYIIVTPNAVRLHYCKTAQLHNVGYNEENLHVFANFFFGSKSLEVLQNYGIYKKIYTD